MTASPTSALRVLTYAAPHVQSSPPRTASRVGGAMILNVLRASLAAVRLSVIALGYVVLAASIAVRFALAIVALVLFLLGGVRWDVVKRRTLGAAQWVDAKVLSMIAFFRRRLAGGAAR